MSVTSTVGSELSEAGQPRRPPASPAHAESSLKRFVPFLAAGVVAVLYFVFLLHYAKAAPTADDWLNILIVHAAIHGHLSFSLLWVQHFESRMLFPNLLVVLLGVPTHYDPRWFIAVSAICYIASFFLILAAVRRYLGREPQTIPTVIFALVWFSLAGIYDALWAFQLGFYLVILALAVVLYCLLIPRRRRPLWLALAAIAAVVASFSFVQGLALWPVGLVLILFSVPLTRKTAVEVGVWLGAAAVTTGLYFWNFNLAGTNSLCIKHCGVGYSLSHPGLTLSYWTRMVGNIIPSRPSSFGPVRSLLPGPTGAMQIVLGGILTAAAVFVVIQSLRERRRKPMVALPLGIVAFALLADMMIVSGRVSLGSPGSAEYTLTQTILLAGLYIFAWEHSYELLAVARPVRRGGWKIAISACVGLSLLVLVSVFASAQFGLDEAEAVSANQQQSGQLAVNMAEVPKDLQSCYVDLIIDQDLLALNDLGFTRASIDVAEHDKLAMFGPAVIGQFRAEGPPRLGPLYRRLCYKATGNSALLQRPSKGSLQGQS